MKLMTKEIEKKAQRQYPKGSDLEQMIVAKFFTPWTNWTWYVMNQDPQDPDYLWGIVDGYEVEMGSFSLSELQAVKGPWGLKIERDLYFKPVTARQLWERLTEPEPYGSYSSETGGTLPQTEERMSEVAEQLNR